MAFQNSIAGLQVYISANATALKKGLAEATASMNVFQKQTQSVLGVLRGFGVAFGAFQVGQFLASAIRTAKDFEFQMSEVAAITNATSGEFKRLEADAIRLGRSTVFTANQVAKLQVEYGRLGFSVDEIINATEATLNLAAATNTDLAQAAEVAGSTVRGFQLDASETVRVTDVMTSSFNKTALSVETFRESMKFVAPIAQAAGASIEETTALLGVLANAGIKGSIAGTSLRRIFSDLTKDGRPLQARLEELGKKGLTLAGAYDEIGRVAQTSLLVLAKNTGQISTLTSELNKAAGEAERVANIRLENLEGDVIRLSSAWEGFILSVTETEGFRNFLQDLTISFNNLTGAVSSVNTVLPLFVSQLKKQGVEVASLEGVSDRLLGKLRQARIEAGKPIDTGFVKFIAENAELGTRELDFLLEKIKEINAELSVGEKARADFEKFAFGKGVNVFDFKPTSDNLSELIRAADAFQASIRTNLNAVNTRIEGQKELLTQVQSKELKKNILDGIESLDLERSTLLGTISAIDAYVKIKKDQVKAVKDAIVAEDGYIQKLEKNLELLRERQKTERTAGGAAALAEPIRRAQELLENIRNGIPPIVRAIGDASRGAVIDAVKQIDVAFKSLFDNVQKNVKKNFETGLFALANQGTIPQLEAQIQNLRDEIQRTTDTSKIPELENQILALVLAIDKATGSTQQFGLAWKENGQVFFDAAKIIEMLAEEALISLSFALGQLLGGLSKEEIFAGLLNNLAGVLSQLGQLAIATGVTVTGIKKSIETLNGPVAIAAGVALLTLAGAVSARARQISQGGRGGGSLGGGSSFTPQSSFAFAQDSSAIRLVSDVQIKGQDLYVVLSNYEKNSRNTRNG
jgi:hypothetical protein